VLPDRDHGEEVAGDARGERPRANFGELSAEALRSRIPVAPLPLKPFADYTIIGTPRGRKNARAIVTGAQKYTLDLGVADGIPANAKPAVVLRPPDIKGRWRRLTPPPPAGRHRLVLIRFPSAARSIPVTTFPSRPASR
jgi:hypothetical protein